MNWATHLLRDLRTLAEFRDDIEAFVCVAVIFILLFAAMCWE